jgi:hypothetical protein
VRVKEDELKKMAAIEARIKAIMEGMSKDKEQLVYENQRMAKELLEVKQLLSSVVLPQQ